MTLNVGKAVVAGLTATAAMTIVLQILPRFGLPGMNIGEFLGPYVGSSVALGWTAHFIIGTLLSFAYGEWFAERLPGALPLRGMLFSLLPWLAMMTLLMPMLGKGYFGGTVLFALGTLLSHLVFGFVEGAMYGSSQALPTLRRPRMRT